MEQIANTIRLTTFLVVRGELHEEYKKEKVLIVQRLHRNPGKLPEDLLKSTNKREGKRFLKWIPRMEGHKLLPQGFFNDANLIVVEDVYRPFKTPEQARKLVSERYKSGTRVINLSRSLEVKTEHFNASGEVKKREFLLVELKESKAENYLEMSEQVMDLVSSGAVKLPETIKGAVQTTFTLLPEFAPDSNNKYGKEFLTIIVD